MSDKKTIQINTEATMSSLDGIQRATIGAYFFTRLEARLNKTKKNIWERIAEYVTRPSIAFAIICLIVLINTLAVLQQKQPTPSFSDQQSEQSVYEEYNVASNTFYDLENTEP